MGFASGETKYSEALTVTLRPSRLALALLLGATALTLAVIAASPIGTPWQAALAGAVLAATAEAVLRVALLRGPFAVHAIRIDLAGAVAVRYATGRERSGLLRAGGFVAPWAAIVRWRPEGGWHDRTVLVLPDMLAAEPFRRLRVWLRMA